MMQRALVVLGLALGVGCIGVGLDVAHPVFFLSEPVVLWTAPGVQDIVLSYFGVPVPVAWTRTPEGERVRWEAVVPGRAGVWVACTDLACHAFLRVSDEVGVIEVQTSPGASLTVAGQRKVPDASGRAFFVVTPGDHVVVAEMGRRMSAQRLMVWPRERVAVDLVVRPPDEPRVPPQPRAPVVTPAPEEPGIHPPPPKVTPAVASVEVSTAVALPGHTVTLFVRLTSPRDFPALNADLVLPEGWEAIPTPGTYDPLRAGEPTVRSWRLPIPEWVPERFYALAIRFPDLGTEAQVVPVLEVADRLPPRVVVAHWDIAANELDLSLPGRITYDRLLWAATFAGQTLPSANRTLSQEDLDALAREWKESP
jgi:hypothetical protein